ncbi:Outer membrane efflux protein BepC [Nymphon striatum]|nr:Outer membrane efflux protein BepC [Nymphon striatum]
MIGTATYQVLEFYIKKPADVYHINRFRIWLPECAIRSGIRASWRSGYAADCKSVYSGSIPDEASISIVDDLWHHCANKHEPQRNLMVNNFPELRRAMVDSQVRTTDVTELRLIEAMFEIPREVFVPAKMKQLAYIDENILLSDNDDMAPRYLMQASPFAKLAQLLEIKSTDLVLDVGCATGYSSAVFSKLADAVIALEVDEDLAARATETLGENGYDSVVVVTGALEQGFESEGPYDVIFVGGSVDEVPQALLNQLKNGGRLAVIEGQGTTAFAQLYLKDDDGVVSNRRTFNLAAKALPDLQVPVLMRKSIFIAVTAMSMLASANIGFAAESIHSALAKAYKTNSALNSGRAGVRIENEGLAIAKSGYRPRVQSTAGITYSSTYGRDPIRSASFGIEINQTLFDGFQTRNNVQAAEAAIRGQRARLLNTELDTLFDAAKAFMDVVQNRKIAAFRAENLAALQEQVRSERARFDVGEGTRTDVAQAEASLAGARAQLASAQAEISSAEATYQQLAARSKLHLLDIPAIIASQALVDANVFSVKSSEGALLPQVSATARATQSSARSGFGTGEGTTTGEVSLGVTDSHALMLMSSRDRVRALVNSAYYELQASRAALTANNETLRAAKLALNGVIEERNVGQRTTLNVLNARTTVLNAQISLAQAERNVVVSSYALASSIGRLTAKRLGLNVKLHNPEKHYNQVKDKWFGLRTPDGR